MKIPLRILILCTLLSTALVHAETTVSKLFDSKMVLQQDMPVHIWGWDEPGQNVTVEFAGQTSKAKAGEDGKWLATLPTLAMSKEGRPLVIKGSSSVTLTDVLVGEVWVLFGRSNVGMPMNRMDNADEEIAKANFPDVRFTNLFGDPTLEPQKDAVTRGWSAFSPNTAKNFSAVGFIFASELNKASGDPVGLVKSNWGGSPGYMWIERGIYEKAFPPGEAQNLEWLAEFEAESQNYHTKGAGAREYAGDKERKVGALYTSYVQPILGLSVRGIIFYCSGTTAEETEVVARTWRKAWGADRLPFLYVQIPPSGGPEQIDPTTGDPGFNAAFFQMDRSGRIEDSAMIVTVDTADQSGKKNIHPSNKRPVGERLALAARGLANGENVVYSGPMYSGHTTSGSQMMLTFTGVDGGLATHGDTLEGFAVSEDGKTWIWAKSAKIEGEKIILDTSLSAPQYIRYAIGNQPKGNLYNQAGLPAAPFATDVTYP